MLAQLVCGLTNQPKFFPPGCQFRIVLRRAIPEFPLDNRADTGDQNARLEYKIEIEDVFN